MINILLVDDEKSSRKKIISFLDDIKDSISNIYEASNANEALTLSNEIFPDILISDIRMPGMNGIDLAKTIQKKHNNCIIIFISGYTDREYLKEAINLNACAFIDKPVEKKELLDTVTKAIDLLYENNSQTNQHIMTNISYALLERNCDFDGIDQQLKIIHMGELVDYNYVTCILNIIGECNLLQLRESLSFYFNTETFKHMYLIRSQNSVIIHLFTTIKTVGELKISINNIFHNFIKDFFADISCQLSVGSLTSSYRQAYSSYTDAACAYEALFFFDNYSIVYYDDINESSEFNESSYLNQFRVALDKRLVSDALEILNNLYLALHHNPIILSSKVKAILNSMLEIIYDVAVQKNIDLASYYDKIDVQCTIYDSYFLKSSIDQVKRILNIFDRLIDQQITRRSIAETAIEHINQNYTNSMLSVSDIAAKCNVTATYLSVVFKNKTGETIISYINKKRVNASIKLLLETDDNLADIAKKSGFNNVAYFCRVFKKHENMTPTMFRIKSKHL